jgi:hypothetical protein
MDQSMFAWNEGTGRGKEDIGLVGHMMKVSSTGISLVL